MPESGLSPRVRGNQPDDNDEICLGRSIPACAGEPRPALGRCYLGRVYPRVCGGTLNEWRRWATHWGLSPRVRGNLIGISRNADGERSIPACAGEPPELLCRPLLSRVYPRVCGGTWLA